VNTSTDLTPETRSRNIPHHLSGLAAVLAPMRGSPLRRAASAGEDRRPEAVFVPTRHHAVRFIIALMRDAGAAQPRRRARPASTLLRMIDRSNSEKSPSVWNMARPPAWSYQGLADADRDRILQHRAPRGSRPSGATIGGGGQPTRPQDISPRHGSRYNNSLQCYFFGTIEERRNEHPRGIDDLGLLRNS
jgi:hypothetical protein